MDQRQQDPVALLFQFEIDAAGTAPADAQPARRRARGDFALHAVVLGGVVPALAGRLVASAVAPDQLEGSSYLHLHVAGGQPLAAQVAMREEGTPAFQRARQTGS